MKGRTHPGLAVEVGFFQTAEPGRFGAALPDYYGGRFVARTTGDYGPFPLLLMFLAALRSVESEAGRLRFFGYLPVLPVEGSA